MLASRLVKSCLFLLVAFAPMAAKASFIIDSFNGSFTNGALPSLPGGIQVTRTVSFLGLGGSFVANGTNATINLNGGSAAVVTYSFTNALNAPVPLSATGDNLGGSPTLTLDFLSANNTVNVNHRINGGLLLNGGSFGLSTGAFTLSFASSTLLSATTLALQFSNADFSNSASFVIDRVTATPEPTTMLMFASVAGAGLVVRRLRNRKVAS